MDPEQPSKNENGKKLAPKQYQWIIIAIAVAGLLIGGIVAAILLNKPSSKESVNQNASELFYKMFAEAAAKKQVHFTYSEKEYGSKQDLDQGKTKSELYSEAEFNEIDKDYRAVYASFVKDLSAPYTFVYRCFDQKTFKPTQLPNTIKTLADVKAVLQQPFEEVATTAGQVASNDCDVNTGTSTRKGKLTDGIIPIGLNQQQIAGWIALAKEAGGLQVADGGTTTYQNKPVRKLQISTDSPSGARMFLSVASRGAGLKLSSQTSSLVGPDSFRIDTIAISSNMQGYYLLDEQTNLPVYSEFITTSLQDDAPGARGFLVKQRYKFPETLHLTTTSSLDIVE